MSTILEESKKPDVGKIIKSSITNRTLLFSILKFEGFPLINKIHKLFSLFSLKTKIMDDTEEKLIICNIS